jgi:hypothetical protein
LQQIFFISLSSAVADIHLLIYSILAGYTSGAVTDIHLLIYGILADDTGCFQVAQDFDFNKGFMFGVQCCADNDPDLD